MTPKPKPRKRAPGKWNAGFIVYFDDTDRIVTRPELEEFFARLLRPEAMRTRNRVRMGKDKAAAANESLWFLNLVRFVDEEARPDPFPEAKLAEIYGEKWTDARRAEVMAEDEAWHTKRRDELRRILADMLWDAVAGRDFNKLHELERVAALVPAGGADGFWRPDFPTATIEALVYRAWQAALEAVQDEPHFKWFWDHLTQHAFDQRQRGADAFARWIASWFVFDPASAKIILRLPSRARIHKAMDARRVSGDEWERRKKLRALGLAGLPKAKSGRPPGGKNPR